MKTNKYLNKENAEALLLRDEINRLGRRRKKLSEQILRLTNKLKEVCVHNETEIVNEFNDGSYYDRKEYITKVVCKVCDKELDKKISYGGYG